jgi:hypothetical protein
VKTRVDESSLPAEMALLLNAVRQEFDAKISGLKAWLTATCVVAGCGGGLVAGLLHPQVAHSAIAAISQLV